MAAGDPIKATDINTIAQASTLAPIVRLIQQAGGTQSLVTATQTALTFGAGSEDIDTDNFHDTASNTSRITPTVAGYYELSSVYASSSHAGTMAVTIAKNGTRVASGSQESTTTSNFRAVVTGPVYQTANGSTDFFETFAIQSSGGPISTLSSGALASVFQCKFLRPL